MRRLICAAAVAALSASSAVAAPPHLQTQGTARQLIVDDRPFLILGGELGNSTASDLAYLKPSWAKFRDLGLNTVLSPVYWELIEPQEGRFDFASVDGLIRDARAADQRLVLLWFGTWKNSMSSYAPAWVKRDQARFPRAIGADGRGQEIISPLSGAARDADAQAFKALMTHLKAIDGDRNTVLMVQVENEIGMLPGAREHSAAADAAWRGQVPAALTAYLASHRATLATPLRQLWEANGARRSGNWSQVFGATPAAEEVFTAWTSAAYTEAVARAGKQAYDLPFYVNGAQNRPGKAPGEYPSGGPLPHLLDVWKAAAPSIDFLAPDIYFENFGQIVAAYDRPGEALFVPEANNAGRMDTPADAFAAIAEHDLIGFSPFSIENASGPGAERLKTGYEVLRQLAPTILANQGRGTMRGVRPKVAFDGGVDETPQKLTLGDWQVTATFVDPWTSKDQQTVRDHGGLVIQLGPDEFLVAGSGVTFTFAGVQPGVQAGLERVDEGRFVDGRWTAGRRMNGDQTHQGRHVRLPPDAFGIQRVKLYAYR